MTCTGMLLLLLWHCTGMLLLLLWHVPVCYYYCYDMYRYVIIIVNSKYMFMMKEICYLQLLLLHWWRFKVLAYQSNEEKNTIRQQKFQVHLKLVWCLTLWCQRSFSTSYIYTTSLFSILVQYTYDSKVWTFRNYFFFNLLVLNIWLIRRLNAAK
jgi:hypothetical protein